MTCSAHRTLVAVAGARCLLLIYTTTDYRSCRRITSSTPDTIECPIVLQSTFLEIIWNNCLPTHNQSTLTLNSITFPRVAHTQTPPSCRHEPPSQAVIPLHQPVHRISSFRTALLFAKLPWMTPGTSVSHCPIATHTHDMQLLPSPLQTGRGAGEHADGQ